MADKPNINLLPFDITELPEEEQSVMLQSIGETETSRRTCLEKLRKMLIEGKYDFHPCLDEEFLLKFLRNSKFNCDKAHTRVKKFYKIQKKLPDFFEIRSEDLLSKVAQNYTVVSPIRLKDNSVLFIFKFFYTAPTRLLVKEKYYLDILLGYYLLKNPLNQIVGSTVLCDCGGLSLSSLPYYSDFKFLKAVIDVYQGSFPMRYKNIHMFNTSELVRVLYKIAYPFLSQKLKSRLHFYSDNVNDLHRFIPPEALPEEYGGHLKESDLINKKEDIQIMEEYFRKHSPRLDSF